MSTLSISFLGGTGTVTGSKHLLSVNDQKLLVDCGLFQGVKEDRLSNWLPLPVDVSKINAVILTHAHLDHTGYLPLLVKHGFKGPIYCSEPTEELTKLILMDSARIQEEDAIHANQHGYSKHSPALPLYTVAEAQKVFPLIQTLPLEQWNPVLDGLAQIRFSNSGHILGSTFIEIKVHPKTTEVKTIAEKTIVFSGDLGRKNPITLKSRKLLSKADILVVESTYGDRCHLEEDPGERLGQIIQKTLSQQGQILIPSFAIGRTQDILYLIHQLKRTHKIPDIPVYVDSPMAEKATSIFDRYSSWVGLDRTESQALSKTFFHVSKTEESMQLCQSTAPAIIIAGSGMINGGRIRHHLVNRISDPRNSVILTGFQAAGTTGRFLREGAPEIKLFGHYFKVHAKIFEVSSLSAHADQAEILEWISGFQPSPQKIFLVHGEPNAAEGLRVRINDRFKTEVRIPKMNETISI